MLDHSLVLGLALCVSRAHREILRRVNHDSFGGPQIEEGLTYLVTERACSGSMEYIANLEPPLRPALSRFGLSAGLCAVHSSTDPWVSA